MEIKPTVSHVEVPKTQTKTPASVSENQKDTSSVMDKQPETVDTHDADVDVNVGLETINKELAEVKFEPEEEVEIDPENYNGRLDNASQTVLENEEGSRVSIDASAYADTSTEVLENGKKETTKNASFTGGVVFSKNVFNDGTTKVNVTQGIGTGIEISGLNNDLILDARTFNAGIGVNGEIQGDNGDGLKFNVALGHTVMNTPVEDMPDLVYKKNNVQLGLDLNTNGLSVSNEFKAEHTDGQNYRADQISFGIDVSKTFQSGSSVGAYLQADASKDTYQDSYGTSTNTDKSITFGANVRKQFNPKTSLSLGAEYTMSTATSKYTDAYYPSFTESDTVKEQRIGASVEYNKDNVTLSGGFDINPDQPKDWNGRIGAKIRF